MASLDIDGICQFWKWNEGAFIFRRKPKGCRQSRIKYYFHVDIPCFRKQNTAFDIGNRKKPKAKISHVVKHLCIYVPTFKGLTRDFSDLSN